MGFVAAGLAACATLAGYPATAAAQVPGSPAPPRVVFSPQPPPTGAEREALIAEIRVAYPTLPERLVPMLANSRRSVDDSSPCELLEWLTSPESTAPEPARKTATTLLPTCRLPVDDLTPDAARAMLGDRALAAEVNDGVITVVLLSTEAEPRVCCSIQGAPERLGESDYWAMRRRLPDADRAMLTLIVPGSPTMMMTPGSAAPQPLVIRGPLAPPAPALASFPLQGQLFERQLASAALGETRRLLIYLPPGWSRDERWPVVYLADGAAGQFAPIVERMIVDGEIRPVVLVSALPAPFGIEGPAPSLPIDPRSAEYINHYPGGLGADRFERHMEFFAGELTRYAQAEFGVSAEREDVSVAGFSSGGVLALWAGLLHPETFGEAIVMSPGMPLIEPGDLGQTPRARFRLSGGLYEPQFLGATRGVEDKLKAEGFEVTSRYLAAGHAQAFRIVIIDEHQTVDFAVAQEGFDPGGAGVWSGGLRTIPLFRAEPESHECRPRGCGLPGTL